MDAASRLIFLLATSIAVFVVFVELWAIAFIQNRYMETPFWRAAMQVVLGGSLVLAAGLLLPLLHKAMQATESSP